MDEYATLFLEFDDTEWEFTGMTHERLIVRAIVVDEHQQFYFVRVQRDDDFGKACLIETAGGGVEVGEDLVTAIQRELREELGVEVDILTKIGVVKDAYHLINRCNLNHYFLCSIRQFGEKNLTQAEQEEFELSTLVLNYEAALSAYKENEAYPLGRLITQREVPILQRAEEILGGYF